MEAKDILTQHAKYYETLIESADSPSVEAATVAAAVLTLAHVISQSGKDLDG
jgi:hypothetical protein